MTVVSLSENSVIVLFEQAISQQTAVKVLKLNNLIKQELSDYIIDFIPSYTSLHVSFNLRKISHQSFKEKIESLTHQIYQKEETNNQENFIDIPVYYDEEVGYDLKEISVKTGLTTDQIIQMHSDKTYDVYALGFSPGFAYLGKVDTPIAIPRKETPRLNVPKGSLGIAGEQTAIYPFDSPGGWNIIGRTPIDLVNYDLLPPCIMQVGDKIKFNPISKSEFKKLGGVL